MIKIFSKLIVNISKLNNKIFSYFQLQTLEHGQNCACRGGGSYFQGNIKLGNRIIIEDDVWIGANVTILKGVTVAKGSVIGAESVVTKSTEPYSINVGNLCKKIKMRFTKEEIIKHEKYYISN